MLESDHNLNIRCKTTVLLHLAKVNELAEIFVERRGFNKIEGWLRVDCIKNDQVAYNVIATCWVLSYHDFSLPYFGDYALNIIEHVQKVLDYYNKEKIVRIVCMLFENLKDDKECLDHLCMVNALNLVMKLQNRPWVDKDITDCLDRLFKFFDANYQEFSSFEKWKKQVSKNQYSWSTVHTEKFWQTAFINFNVSENLELIKKEITFLQENNKHNAADICTKRAVICFDLGEFARFFPHGRGYLEMSGAKEALQGIMGDSQVTPELKKEAITAYQKILMKSWG